MRVPRRLTIFLVLLLPVLAALMAGLARAWRSGGQADPWNWALPAALMVALMAQLLARDLWRWLVWIAVGAAGAALIFCTIAAARPPDPWAAVGLLLVMLLAGFGSRGIRDGKTRLIGIGLLALAGLLLWRGPAQPIASVAQRPALAVITALPLFWDKAGLADAPIITLLRTRFTVRPLDDPRALAKSGARALLLAQPRAMTPDQLVAIDTWVRAGGTALVLADPSLRWPSDLPPGDRRRAPSASLIDPLLRHWGAVQDALVEAETRQFLDDGRLVTLFGAQSFKAGGACAAEQGGGIVRCRVGQGGIVLVGDADLIDDRLWLADPARPLDPRAWAADTPALVAQWLGGPITGERRWLRAGSDVVLGLRWALILGIIWAMVGMALFSRTGQRAGHSADGNKS
ncbi:GldG family protein [Sphingobium sp. AS12]|uniref:GldG family protein n=1 Tax=Sphingobium sp. AS12 TaxID=2849495 RepID=UPI0020C86BC4|nr:GldG family protein [Sphingobium sp. AS12]